jgi:hypothetical protein
MKHPLTIILILCLIISCAGYRKTRFTLTSVKLGDHINLITQRFGIPFKSSAQFQNDTLLTKVYYKEAVDISSYTYMLTTELIFKDSVLTNIVQNEEYLPNGQVINIKKDTVP